MGVKYVEANSLDEIRNHLVDFLDNGRIKPDALMAKKRDADGEFMEVGNRTISLKCPFTLARL